MAEVEVIVVPVQMKDGKGTDDIAKRLSQLRNDGWVWATAGGGTGKLYRDIAGFVILERPKPQ